VQLPPLAFIASEYLKFSCAPLGRPTTPHRFGPISGRPPSLTVWQALHASANVLPRPMSALASRCSSASVDGAAAGACAWGAGAGINPVVAIIGGLFGDARHNHNPVRKRRRYSRYIRRIARDPP